VFLLADEILYNAEEEDIAFLVVGDPFGFVYSFLSIVVLSE